eukprot:scaffold25537_cov255-Cylindrotheca_fusiformis.AAC.1
MEEKKLRSFGVFSWDDGGCLLGVEEKDELCVLDPGLLGVEGKEESCSLHPGDAIFKKLNDSSGS